MFVTALKSFDHNGKVQRGAVFECSDIMARELERANLVSIDEESLTNPSLAACKPSSALPPVLPLPQTIAKPLESGEIPKLRGKPGRKKKLL